VRVHDGQGQGDGVAFGLPAPDPDGPAGGPLPDVGPNATAVAAIVERAAHLTDAEAHQLAAVVAWRWVPLGLPATVGVAGARATAIARARRSGRADGVDAAIAAARSAAAASPGGRSTRRGWPSAETALAVVVIGIAAGVASALAGIVALAALFAVVALAGAVLLLFLESAFVRRQRLGDAVAAAVLAEATRDLIDDGTLELLAGPWRAVMRD
jgi:hypothetical protein